MASSSSVPPPSSSGPYMGPYVGPSVPSDSFIPIASTLPLPLVVIWGNFIGSDNNVSRCNYLKEHMVSIVDHMNNTDSQIIMANLNALGDMDHGLGPWTNLYVNRQVLLEKYLKNKTKMEGMDVEQLAQVWNEFIGIDGSARSDYFRENMFLLSEYMRLSTDTETIISQLVSLGDMDYDYGSWIKIYEARNMIEQACLLKVPKKKWYCMIL